MTDTISGAQYIAATLKGYGTTHVFFVDAILRRTLIELEAVGITRVMAHSEKAAAYMADGYARVSGRPGVCMAQSVGAANLGAGLQDPFLARSPVIAMTGRKLPVFQHRNAYQELDHRPLFAATTKFSANVDAIDQLPTLLPQAFREATTGSPRPVHLDLAGLQAEAIESATIARDAVVQVQFARAPAFRPAADAAALAAAVRAIDAAQRPLIVCGSGAVQAGAHNAVLALAEALDAPVATSLGGRGIVPTTHRLSLGVIGTYSAPPANRIAHAADLVVYVGCSVGDQVTHNWTIPAAGTPIVQIDIDPTELGRNYAATIAILADPGLAAAALAAAARRRDAGTWSRRAQEALAAWRASIAAMLAASDTPIRPDRLCAELSRALPETAILVSDTGYSAVWSGTLIDLPSPRQTYLRAAGSLGWAFPASLGVKCAAPDRPVVCFCGDGAFHYHLPELETAVRKGIAVTVVVNNNSAFAQGRATIRRLYGNRPGDPDDINAFRKVDFAAIARGFGAEGIRVESPDAIAAALQSAFASPRVTVVDVVTDPAPRAPEAWIPAAP
ncbi:MAG: thiamine pyrophosphate-binding protein [Alphaproteobacteria bacterium]|nr:thiamine pyrophosphate-binding protein [Alphaproteobacteria bacterium]